MNTKPQNEREVYQTVPFIDKLNNIISKLIAVSDFTKRIGDDSFLLEEETPLGLHLFINDCIDDLRDLKHQIENT